MYKLIFYFNELSIRLNFAYAFPILTVFPYFFPPLMDFKNEVNKYRKTMKSNRDRTPPISYSIPSLTIYSPLFNKQG